jgi:polyisoprenyl-teichoic acid--peptidoglycan teichoic acid transferase
MSEVAPPRTGRRPSTEQQSRSARVRFRRALALLLMTLVLPGSAQLVAGSKRWGRVTLRVVATVFLLSLGLLIAAKFWPTEVSALLFEPGALAALRVLLVVAALVWVALFVDAWRIGDPLGLGRRQRLALFSMNSLLCVAVAAALLVGSNLVSVHRSLVVDMFGNGPVSATEGGRYNVLLLGGDAGATREGLRPDSITVASIDEDTGRTVLFSLPRNLEEVPFPEDNPMDERFPSGFDCPGCYLNALYTWATDHAGLFPDDVGDVGVYATKAAVEEITGLKLNYYAMVDLRGFRDLVDAVGGVTVTVPQRLPIGGVQGDIKGWIESGRQHLDGYETLWFARSRLTTDDYSRMARQKCVMSAMLNQLSPRTVLTRFQEIAAASKRVVTTDVPASELSTFLDLAGKARSLPVASVSFVPPQIETYDPDYDKIRAMVGKALERAEAADEPADEPAAEAGDGEAGEAARTGSSASGPGTANQTAALSGAC